LPPQSCCCLYPLLPVSAAACIRCCLYPLLPVSAAVGPVTQETNKIISSEIGVRNESTNRLYRNWRSQL